MPDSTLPGDPPDNRTFRETIGRQSLGGVAAGQEFATQLYLATIGSLTIGEVAYRGFTAAQGGNRLCWEVLSHEDRRRWEQSAAAVVIGWRERTGGDDA